MAISIADSPPSIGSNRVVQNAQRPGFTFTLSTFKYLWTNKFAASAEIPRRENIFRKIPEKLSLRFEPSFERVPTLIQRNFARDTEFGPSKL